LARSLITVFLLFVVLLLGGTKINLVKIKVKTGCAWQLFFLSKNPAAAFFW